MLTCLVYIHLLALDVIKFQIFETNIFKKSIILLSTNRTLILKKHVIEAIVYFHL